MTAVSVTAIDIVTTVVGGDGMVVKAMTPTKTTQGTMAVRMRDAPIFAPHERLVRHRVVDGEHTLPDRLVHGDLDQARQLVRRRLGGGHDHAEGLSVVGHVLVQVGQHL